MPQDLQHDVLRGQHGQPGGRGPAAAFRATESIKKSAGLAFQPGKIFLGVVDAEMVDKRLPNGRLDRHAQGGAAIGAIMNQHIVTVAGSRTGKGRAALIPNLLTYPGSVLAIDPKGELARETAQHREQELGHTVHVLDPFGESPTAKKYRACFNPLSILDPDGNIVEDAGLIADALIVPSGTDAHWDDTARNLLEGIILHVVTEPAYENCKHLGTVYQLIMQGKEGMEELHQAMKNNTAAENAVRDAAAAFFDKDTREKDATLSTLRRHVRFLGYRKISDSLCGPSISLSKLKTEKTTIYLCLPALRLGTCSRWLRLFVNLALAALEEEKAIPQHPALFLLDEFAILGHMKTLEDAAGQIAGLGCLLWPVLQDLTQLKALYKDRWETFLGNAGVVQFFGNSDMTTLEWISKRLGQTTIKKESGSAAGRKVEDDTNLSSGVQDLMTPEEISRFFGRDDPLLRQLIIRSGRRPLIIQRAFYDSHELFKKTVFHDSRDLFKQEPFPDELYVLPPLAPPRKC
jgi:type IV secretion system protein VirD4